MRRQAEYLEAHPDCSMVYCGASVQYADADWSRCPSARRTRRMRTRWNSSDRLENVHRMLFNNYITACTTMLRSDLTVSVAEKMKHLQDYVGWVPSEDFVYWIFRGLAGRIHYVDGDMAVYRMHCGSLSGNSDVKTAYARILGDWRVRLGLVHMFQLESSVDMRRLVTGFVASVCDFLSLQEPSLRVLPNCCSVALRRKDLPFSRAYRQVVQNDWSRVQHLIRRSRFRWRLEHTCWGLFVKRMVMWLMRV